MDIIGATVSRPTPHGRAVPLARIAATGRLIDLIVYRLYGLTEEEIAVVEGSASDEV